VRPRAHDNDRGFTLLEVFLAAAILAIILVVTMTLWSAGVRTSSRSALQGSVQEEAGRAMERLARELKDSGEQSTGWQVGVDPAPYDQFYGQDVGRISFSRCVGYDAGLELLEWSPVVTWEFVPGAGAQPGTLVRTENGNATPVCSNVNAFTLRYEADRSTVVITLVIQQENPESRGQFVRASYTTTVALRN